MKTDNHVLEQLPDYLAGRMSSEEKAKVDQHLDLCEACRREYATLSSVWAEMGKLPDPQPGSQLPERFYAELNEPRSASQDLRDHKRSGSARFGSLLERLWPKQPAVQIAFSLVCLLAGYIVGFRIDRGGSTASENEVALLRNEIQTMRTLVVTSLLKTQSASDRIQGVSWTEGITRPDEDVLGALFEALNYDPNVNVRLAAVDVLAKHYDQLQVRQTLIASLSRQTSPLVQLSLVDAITANRDKDAASVLNQFLKTRDLDKTVREQVQKRLTKMSSQG